MAYDGSKPANDGFLADFPPEMREQLRAIIQDQIVNALRLCGLTPGNGNGNIPVNNGNLNTNLNAEKLGGQYSSAFAAAGHGHSVATGSSNGFMSNSDKAKMDTIATSAEVNQNAFSNVNVNGSVIQADNKTDTLTLEAGANITLTPDVTNDKVNIAVTGVVPNAGTADYAQYLWSTTHRGTFFIYNAWDGTYWNFISNHGAPVRVGYADNSNTVGGASLSQLVRSDISQNISDSVYHSYTKNGGNLCIGGLRPSLGDVSCVTTDGTNLVLDSRNSGDIYLGYYGGKNVNFCGGSNTIKSHIDSNGVFQGTANYATTAGNANAVNGHVFNWSGQDGQPTWLWGGNDASNMYVYNPSNFSVNNANYANLVNPLSGDSNYKLGYTADGQRTNAGEWGRVVMRYTPNGQTYGVRCDRADSADAVNGYSADALKNRIGGRNTPVLTPLIDWSKAQGVGTNSGAGLTGQGSGDIYLKQSYKNFDKILIHMIDGDANWTEQFLWEKWEIDYAMGNSYRWTLGRSGSGANWIVWSGVNLGTATHPLSTETCWKLQSNNCRIKEIYGLTY